MNRRIQSECGGAAFFVAAGLLTLFGEPVFSVWGSVLSSLAMAGLWLGSLVVGREPLCAAYSKWGVIRRLWRTSLFIHPNAVISLMWGWQFILAAGMGAGALASPAWMPVLTALRYLLLVPAFVFTSWYKRGRMTGIFPTWSRRWKGSKRRPGVACW
jgi:hypothetical protein